MSNEMTSQNQITEGGILRPLLAFFFPILLGTFSSSSITRLTLWLWATMWALWLWLP